jgi:hypothetical protein
VVTTVALGADLHVGDVIAAIDGPHTIDHFGPYPGRFVGDHARRAYYDAAETCGCTVADHEKFHIQSQEG